MARVLVAALLILVALPALAVTFLLILPRSVRTHRFDAPLKRPLEGVLAPNTALEACELFAADAIDGPEELEVDAAGWVYAGTNAGTIVRLRIDGRGSPTVEVFAEPGGRPNGLTFDREGHLIVSDGYHVPHSRIDPLGGVVPYTQLGAAGGDAAVARDGRVFFPSLPPWKRTGQVGVDFLVHMLEASPDGELRVFDPVQQTSTVLLDDLLVPDGIALSSEEAFVAVNELGAYRIRRYWLTGPKAGTDDILVDNLPGLPDGLASDGRGTFYVALPVRRNDALDWLHQRPFMKDQLVKVLTLTRTLPRPAGSDYGLVLAIDEDGDITRSFHDPGALVGGGITTAQPSDAWLYLGSLAGRGIARCPLDASVAAGRAPAPR